VGTLLVWGTIWEEKSFFGEKFYTPDTVQYVNSLVHIMEILLPRQKTLKEFLWSKN